MFKRKNPELKEIDLINKFSIVENKIDILNSKFEAITFLDGCCQCQKRENKIYEMLVDYFETKFKFALPEEKKEFVLKEDLDVFKTNLLLELKNICTVSDNSNVDLKEMIREVLENQRQQPVVIDHQEYHIKHQNGIANIKTDLVNLVENNQKLDVKLRNDLQSFLIALQNNVLTEVKQQFNINENNISSSMEVLKSSLQSIDTKVDGFYFENELIKHQLILEDEIRRYNDDIDALKLIITNTTSQIETIFSNFNYTDTIHVPDQNQSFVSER
jgi:hypothetical protein